MSTPDPTIELQTLLTRLTVAFARRRSYPGTHPLVLSAEQAAFESLSASFAGRPRWTLSVGDGVLYVDGAVVERGASIARELSDRLRIRGIGTLVFDVSATAESLRQAVAWLALDPYRPEHREATQQLPTLPGITITRIAYGSLVLGDGPSTDATGVDVWRALASVALFDLNATATSSTSATRAPVAGSDDRVRHTTGDHTDAAEITAHDAAGADSSPADVAEAIERRVTHEGYARRVAFVLLRVAEQVAQAPDSHRDELSERLRAVLSALRASSVSAIVKSVGVGADQRRFISQVLDALPAGAVVEWLESAAQATDAGLSPHMLRLMSKLSAHAQAGGRESGEDRGFRGAARDVIQGWQHDHGSAREHLVLLDQIAAFDAARTGQALPDVGAVRVVHQALETNCFGASAHAAVQTLLTDGRVADLLAWAETAPTPEAAAALHAALHAPDAVREVLLHDAVDHSIARQLLASLDVSAADTLIDVLRDAPARAARRFTFDRLREFGPSLTPLYIVRLNGAPWFLVRNLLALLRDAFAESGHLAGTASGSAIMGFLEHPQEQVRLEAVRLLVNDPQQRADVIGRVLEDPSDRVVHLALEAFGSLGEAAGAGSVPPELAKRLLRFLDAGHRDDELRARAIRALAGAKAVGPVRDRLLALITKRSRVFKRVALHDPTPTVLAAVEVLALRYAPDPTVAPMLDLAVKHEDRRMRDAVERARVAAGRAA